MCQGVGKFAVCLLDALGMVAGFCEDGDGDWLARGFVYVVSFDEA